MYSRVPLISSFFRRMSTSVHVSSVQGFAGADSTSRYHNVRPSYPSAALQLITERIVESYNNRQFVNANDHGVALAETYRPIRILDLGCGTGISAVALAKYMHEHISESYEFELYAADPGQSMVEKYEDVLSQLEGTDPHVRKCMHSAVVSSADKLPFPRYFFDAIVCGQSLHWFDTAPEITAVAQHLTPNGSLIWMWNEFSKDCKWADDFYEDLIQPLRLATNTPHQSTNKWRDAVDLPIFTPELGSAVVPGVESYLTVPEIIERYESTSVVNMLPKEEKEKMFTIMRNRMKTEPVNTQKDGKDAYKIWYDTQVYWKVKQQ